ncbi:bifunctional precorrin-2 dehydrogenase/sirohydrochlorin ferrochelatase [Peribacillus sp. SCS-155]|uniref:precorrin-2 dehydrogenase/sirohydrochlorin ferrochelatase family protein n=1 Tax=Peribacillus sedimenti TaxID=3115297 RepID=UPI0039058260
MYPVMLDLSGKLCVIIGGGRIAFRRIGALLEAGAQVRVVSPKLCEEISELSDDNKVTVLRKVAEKEDYKDAFLIIAASDSTQVNREVQENSGEHQLVNVASDHELGNFHIPAVAARGKLVIGISTSGASPHLAKKIKDRLLNEYDESYEEYLEFLSEERKIINRSALDPSLKTKLLSELTDEKYKEIRIERMNFDNRLQSMLETKP